MRMKNSVKKRSSGANSRLTVWLTELWWSQQQLKSVTPGPHPSGFQHQPRPLTHTKLQPRNGSTQRGTVGAYKIIRSHFTCRRRLHAKHTCARIASSPSWILMLLLMSFPQFPPSSYFYSLLSLRTHWSRFHTLCITLPSLTCSPYVWRRLSWPPGTRCEIGALLIQMPGVLLGSQGRWGPVGVRSVGWLWDGRERMGRGG